MTDPRVPNWSIDPLRPVETDLPPAARRSTHVERERSGAVSPSLRRAKTGGGMSLYRVLEATARDLDVDVRELIACIPVAFVVCLALWLLLVTAAVVGPE